MGYFILEYTLVVTYKICLCIIYRERCMFFWEKICIVFSDEATMESVFISHKDVRMHFVGAHCYYAVFGILVGF